MSRTTIALPIVAAGALAVTTAAASAAEPTTEELMRQIDELKAKVQQLENNQQQATTQREVDATVERVLRDAERRSQLLQIEGFTAGWDNGFKIQSADGKFLLNPYFQFQFRNVTNFVESQAIFNDDGDIVGFDGDSDVQNGFDVRRMKLGFRGNAFDPKLTYNFRWGTQNTTGNLRLELAYAQWQWREDIAFRAGQWKDHWTHEESVSSERQLAVDRSLLNELLGGGLTDYVQGVAMVWTPGERWRGEFAYHDGLNTDNTDWQENIGGIDIVSPNWGTSARLEYKVMGNWKAYNDFSARGNTEDLLVIGAGMDFTQGGDQDLWLHTIDAQWENANGLGLYGAYVANWIDGGPAGTDDTYNWGFLGQVGYMINEKLEAFARFDYTKFDFDTVTGGDDFSELTFGVNYFLEGHAAKFTLDFVWLFDGSPNDITGIGVLASDDDEWVIRAQFQLLL